MQMLQLPRFSLNSIKLSDNVVLKQQQHHCPSIWKYYFCFQIDGKSAHASQCAKSGAFNKFIDSILDIEPFEQQCVVLKVLFQSKQQKQHIITDRVYQLLSNSEMY